MQKWSVLRVRSREASNQRREDLFGEFSATCLLRPKGQGRRTWRCKPPSFHSDCWHGEKKSLEKIQVISWVFFVFSRNDIGSGIGYSKDEGQVKPHGDPNKSSREASLPSHKSKVCHDVRTLADEMLVVSVIFLSKEEKICGESKVHRACSRTGFLVFICIFHLFAHAHWNSGHGWRSRYGEALIHSGYRKGNVAL